MEADDDEDDGDDGEEAGRFDDEAGRFDEEGRFEGESEIIEEVGVESSLLIGVCSGLGVSAAEGVASLQGQVTQLQRYSPQVAMIL